MKGQVAYGTIQEHMRALKFFENYIGGSIMLSKIQPRNAESFIAHRLASVCCPATVNKDIGTLHRIFNLAIEPRGYLADETAQLPANLQVQAKESFPYIFISPERLERIRERQKAGKWNSRSDVINNFLRDFDIIRRRASIVECSFHDFRRSAISNWAGQLPIQVVQ